jgi:hypothetical protein
MLNLHWNPVYLFNFFLNNKDEESDDDVRYLATGELDDEVRYKIASQTASSSKMLEIDAYYNSVEVSAVARARTIYAMA